MVHSDAKSVSIPVPDMSALIARLEAAEAGSWELSRSVLTALGGIDRSDPRDACETWAIANHWSSGTSVSSSFDDALALAERLLGQRLTINVNVCRTDGSKVEIYPDDPWGGEVQAMARTPALALCIAILKAKAQGEGGHG